ncbi:MAG: hypothetical protein Q8N89_14615 [Azonexus sp.]|nr:hypothetical protein [Azonexus sp.]
MLGFVILLLAVALPLGIAFLTVRATEAERKVYDHSPVRRLSCALVFGLAAVLGVLWVFRGTGPEYAPAMGLFLGIPASSIAALLAAVGQRFLVGRSKVVATLSGIAITIFTALATSLLVAIFFAPGSASSFVAAFGAIIVLSPSGFPVLLFGGLAGLLLSHLSNRKRPNPAVNTGAAR